MSTAKIIPIASDSFDGTAASERYRQAYRSVGTSMRLADSIKYGSSFVAGVIVIVAVLIYQSSRSERFGIPVMSISLVAGAVLVVLAANLWSAAVRLQARRLEISIDSAVNSSPFLSNAERATLMSVHSELVAPKDTRKKAA